MRPEESLEANLIRLMMDRPTRKQAEAVAAGIVEDIRNMIIDMNINGVEIGEDVIDREWRMASPEPIDYTPTPWMPNDITSTDKDKQ
jgi:hypothetical protein